MLEPEPSPGDADENAEVSKRDDPESGHSASHDLRPLDQIGNLTQSAVGYPERNLLFLPIVASKERTAWLQNLQRDGFACLLYVDMLSSREQAGFSSS